MNGELVVKGQRVVRIRRDSQGVGPFWLRMFIVTNVHDRKRIGIRHLRRADAARWVAAQGWLYIGPQERL